MFSFVFQSSIHGDEDVIPPSDVKIPPSDVKVILSSDAKEVESDGVVNSQQEKQVLCDLLCVTAQELCDCPRFV